MTHSPKASEDSRSLYIIKFFTIFGNVTALHYRMASTHNRIASKEITIASLSTVRPESPNGIGQSKATNKEETTEQDQLHGVMNS
jgi:hypothetical protein